MRNKLHEALKKMNDLAATSGENLRNSKRVLYQIFSISLSSASAVYSTSILEGKAKKKKGEKNSIRYVTRMYVI